MILRDEVARLKKLEATALPAPWKRVMVGDCDHKRILVALGDARGYTAKDIPDPDACLICDLIRAGDAEILDHAIRWICSTNAHSQIIGCLKRYQSMAAKMEAE
jgi:hypothetical protein